MHLVYTTLGGRSDYVQMARLMFSSIVAQRAVGVVCAVMADDETYARLAMPQILQLAYPPEADGVKVSMRKLAIFDHDLSPYDRVLYLDVDMLVNMSIAKALALPLDPHHLGVFRENLAGVDWIATGYYSLGAMPYTDAELAAMAAAGQSPFNAGTFLFCANETMRAKFEVVRALMRSYVGPYFWEQSFMNYCFLRDGTAQSVFRDDCYSMRPHAQQIGLLHFVYGEASKLERMLAFSGALRADGAPLLFESRRDMLRAMTPPGSRIAEVGVFKGDFLRFLLTLRPHSVAAIDLFALVPRMISGDEDGNFVEEVDMARNYAALTAEFAADARVTLVQGDSAAALAELADDSLDLAYLDGDHSYEGVCRDLLRAYDKVKCGGLIAGHDYEMNAAKARSTYNFGVRRAVDEFCAARGLSICAKGLDGCVSYAVRVRKAPAAAREETAFAIAYLGGAEDAAAVSASLEHVLAPRLVCAVAPDDEADAAYMDAWNQVDLWIAPPDRSGARVYPISRAAALSVRRHATALAQIASSGAQLGLVFEGGVRLQPEAASSIRSALAEWRLRAPEVEVLALALPAFDGAAVVDTQHGRVAWIPRAAVWGGSRAYAITAAAASRLSARLAHNCVSELRAAIDPFACAAARAEVASDAKALLVQADVLIDTFARQGALLPPVAQ